MVTRLLRQQERENERLLRGLERRYDKQGENFRRFGEDKAALAKLRERRVIDRDHYDLLFGRACDQFWAAEWVRLRPRRQQKQITGIDRFVGNVGKVIGVFIVIWMVIFWHWLHKIGL